MPQKTKKCKVRVGGKDAATFASYDGDVAMHQALKEFDRAGFFFAFPPLANGPYSWRDWAIRGCSELRCESVSGFAVLERGVRDG